MHCLPAHRGYEVTDDVIDHPNSWVFPQAKNRKVVSKGVFALLLNETIRKNYLKDEIKNQPVTSVTSHG